MPKALIFILLLSLWARPTNAQPIAVNLSMPRDIPMPGDDGPLHAQSGEALAGEDAAKLENRVASIINQYADIVFAFSKAVSDLDERLLRLEQAQEENHLLRLQVAQENREVYVEKTLEMVKNHAQAVIRLSSSSPVAVRFPGEISRGYRMNSTVITVDRYEDTMILFLEKEKKVGPEGEAILVRMENGSWFALKVLPPDELHPADSIITLKE